MNELFSIYQMPAGDWAFSVVGIISDGYRTEKEALYACIKQLLNCFYGVLEKNEEE